MLTGIRYADDFLVNAKSEAELVFTVATKTLDF